MNVPALRFPEFDEDWQTTKLAKLVDKKRKITYGIVQPGEFVDEGVFLVRGGDYSNGWSPREAFKKVTAEIDRPYRRSKLKAGDLLITIVGANTGNVATVPDWLEDANITQTTARIAVERTIAAPQFIEKILGSRKGQKEVYKYIKGAAQPGLNLSDLEKFQLTVPSLPEQKKIAAFLGVVDAKIAALRDRVAGLERYKRGLMQALFSQTLRFTKPDGTPFPDWEEKRLGDVFGWGKTNSLSRENLNYEGGEAQNIHYGDIHTKFRATFRQSQERVPFVSVGAIPNGFADVEFCQIGDVVIADASEDYADIGKAIEVVELAETPLVAGLHTYIARPKGGLALGFSGYLLRSASMRQQIMRIAQGISVLGVSKTNLEKLILNLPHPDEQAKIAEALSAMDTKIDAVTEQLERMQDFKKGLLQQMFV